MGKRNPPEDLPGISVPAATLVSKKLGRIEGSTAQEALHQGNPLGENRSLAAKEKAWNR